MNRTEKQQAISDIRELVGEHSATIIAHYKGLTVAEIQVLRGQLRECGAQMKVIKNSLAKLAVADTDNISLDPLLKGPTAILVSNDPVSMAKNLTKFAKGNANLVLLGGIVDNQFVDDKSIDMLSQMPSKDELRGKIIGLLNAPATKLVRVLKAPAEQLARVISAYSSK